MLVCFLFAARIEPSSAFPSYFYARCNSLNHHQIIESSSNQKRNKKAAAARSPASLRGWADRRGAELYKKIATGAGAPVAITRRGGLSPACGGCNDTKRRRKKQKQTHRPSKASLHGTHSRVIARVRQHPWQSVSTSLRKGRSNRDSMKQSIRPSLPATSF